VEAAPAAGGDRRLEAGTYLSSGYGVRLLLEQARGDWCRFAELADSWAPPRIKQILVDPKYGVPYLNTSQVFDVRPRPRKFLAFAKTSAAETRLARQGTILVMASASPGRSTLVTRAHENAFISHHFLRVVPKDPKLSGWVYAFLRSPQGFAMMQGAQYASIIRHIEPHHLGALPVPMVTAAVAADFRERVARIVELRNESFARADEADLMFETALGPISHPQTDAGFTVQASALSNGRRRLEAAYHTPCAADVIALFDQSEPLRDVVDRAWWMTRFKRYFGDGGIPYTSADELFSIDPQENKRILVSPTDNHRDYFVDPGWIVMACSGQVYGLNGAAMLMTSEHANVFFSHDLIRIVADRQKIRPGYLVVALTHPTHGRPVLIRAAYGTSIPHLDPNDVLDFPVVRLSESTENAIADLAERAAAARAEARAIERAVGRDAGELIDEFLRRR
jgi:hypothetical protein